MKTAVLYGNRDLRVTHIPKPTAGDDGVLIKIKAVGVCGTDLHTYKLGMFKDMTLPEGDGVLFVHEFAGDVADIALGAQLEDTYSLTPTPLWVPPKPSRRRSIRPIH